MGGSLSTIRWTPSYFSTGIDPSSGSGTASSTARPPSLRKSKSFPPSSSSKAGGGPPPSSGSPGNSTSNLSYDTYVSWGDRDQYDYGYCGEEQLGGSSGTANGMGGDHLGTSGILMGANAPPLYDACLVGRWDDVLRICGAEG